MAPIKNISPFRYLFLLIGFFNAINIQAQIENISVSKEINIDRLYAGLLTTTQLLNQHTAYSNFSSFQFGARVNLLLMPEILKIRSFGVFKTTEQHDTKFIRSYEAIITPNKSISIYLGVMATPTTKLRPNPTTWHSQVETNSESNILGGKPGAKIEYNFSKNLSLTYGLHNHGKKAAHHLKFTFKQYTIAGYLEGNNLFVALRRAYKNGNLLVTKFKRKTSISSIIPISKHYKFYVDIEYDDAFQELTYGELGFRRYFPDTHLVKGFLSLSYNNKFNNFQGGLFIHI